MKLTPEQQAVLDGSKGEVMAKAPTCNVSDSVFYHSYP